MLHCFHQDRFMALKEDLENIIYMNLYTFSKLSDGNHGVRVIYEDEWPIEDLAKRLEKMFKEYIDRISLCAKEQSCSMCKEFLGKVSK